MSLTAGSVTVNGAGEHSGSGTALALYLARKAAWEGVTDPGLQGVAFLQWLAEDCNATVLTLFEAIASDAVVSVTISTETAGLQRTTAEGEPTDAPEESVELTGGIR